VLVVVVVVVVVAAAAAAAYFVIDSVRKLLDTPSYMYTFMFEAPSRVVFMWVALLLPVLEVSDSIFNPDVPPVAAGKFWNSAFHMLPTSSFTIILPFDFI